jgi:hypothetical protein
MAQPLPPLPSYCRAVGLILLAMTWISLTLEVPSSLFLHHCHWILAAGCSLPDSATHHTVSGSLRHEVILFRGREGQEGLTQSGEFHTPLFISSNSRLAVLAGILGGM